MWKDFVQTLRGVEVYICFPTAYLVYIITRAIFTVPCVFRYSVNKYSSDWYVLYLLEYIFELVEHPSNKAIVHLPARKEVLLHGSLS